MQTRISLAILALYFGDCFFPAGAQFPAAYLQQTAAEASENGAALDAAYKELVRGRMGSTNRIVVIRRVGRSIVVSFFPSAPNVRDGRANVVYDPRKKQVVYISSDG